ncbi:MAG TPA: ABC transporter substrate-binding protein [Kofleriaceae bacterium]|jgi:iron complex transport system substrate-binding protein|nr:ABC transporter substrate-binding protein [Kofleriaceae bacterium]
MTRTGIINLAAMFAVLAVSLSAAMVIRRDSATAVTVASPAPGATTYLVDLGNGRRGVRDAADVVAPVVDYRRILSGSSTADWLLSELCEPDRVIAVTRRSLETAPWRYRYAGKPMVASLENIETLLAMQPDLLILDSFGDPRRVARLREQGLQVFDLGQMRGASSVLTAMRRVGALLGRAARAEQLARRYQRSLSALAADVPEDRRPRAMYLGVYGDKLFGGAAGTAYHDILVYGGLRDAAADRFDGFPDYSPEQVLGIDPDVIVTHTGGGDPLCHHAGLRELGACRRPGGIVEVDSFTLDDPGVGILEAAEAIASVVHPAPAP